MFDNLSKSEQNNKQAESVDDIFADTDQTAPANNPPKNSNQMPAAPNTINQENIDPELQADPLMMDSNERATTGSSKIMKPLIIILAVVLIVGGAYFLLQFFGVLDRAPADPSPSIVVDNDADLNNLDELFSPSPDLIDPFLIIGDEDDPDEVIFLPEIDDEYLEPIEPEEIKISWRDLPLLDSDGDGLSDITEDFIGTNPLNPDSDGDGYSDYQELMYGYNPLGEGTLPADFPVVRFSDNGLSFFYSQTWSVEKLTDNNWQLKSPVDQTSVQINRQQNQYSDIFTWYAATFADLNPVTSNRLVYNTQLGSGIVSLDGSILIFASSDNNYILRLDLEIDNNDINHSGPLALLINTLSQQ